MRRVYAVLAILAAVGPARAAGHKAVAPVPPTLEIEVLDPNVDPVGNPAVLTFPRPDGRLGVDIPPSVIVHRYYYTGDRNFQGPMLPGGPSIVVVTHPRSGERLYVPVQLLPGAPRVTYRPGSILYDYGEQSIELTFSLCGNPKVTYRQGKKVCEELKDFVVRTGQGAKSLYQRTDLPVCKERCKEATKNVAVTVVDQLNDIGRLVVLPFAQVARRLPGAARLTSTPEDRAEELRAAQARRAEFRPPDPSTVFIPSGR